MDTSRLKVMVGASLTAAMRIALRDRDILVIEATPEELEHSRRAAQFPIVKFLDGEETLLKAELVKPNRPWYQRGRNGRPARY